MRMQRSLPAVVAIITVIAWVASSVQGAPPRGKKSLQLAAAPVAAKKPAAPESFPQRIIAVTKVDPSSRPQVLKSAAKIDNIVDQNLAKHKLEPNAHLSDELFLRRVFLDITGAIPSFQQARSMLATRRANNDEWRSGVIDSLLNTDGYASHMFNQWADILRLRDEMFDRTVSAASYNEWVRRCFEENTHFDTMVFKMLTAEGKYLEHPETGYVIKDSNMPLDAVNNTIRIFLGTQIGCAQCHNHPFENWSQKEFYQIAAFTTGLQTKQGLPQAAGKDHAKVLMADLDKIKKNPNQNAMRQFRESLGANLLVVGENAKKVLKLPKDYRYDDGKPESEVKPHVLFEPAMEVKPGESPRVTFAKWVTSKENPRFARTIANRMWKKYFGAGQIEPVDDIKNDTVPENPELMTYVEQEMIRVNFDLKEFQRIILNSKAYQREASHQEVQPGEEYHFPGPILRRMTAEQAWDSFVTLASFHDPREYHREPAAHDAQTITLDLSKATAQDVEKAQKAHQNDTKNDKSRLKPYEYKGLNMVRASELPLPLPEGHFLREFGQSDHQEIGSSHTDGSVLQALQMFNGPITHSLLEPTSIMYKNVTSMDKIEDRIDVVFLSVLCRRPSDDQRRLARQEIQKHGNAGYGNVIWALVNTPEFLYVQ